MTDKQIITELEEMVQQRSKGRVIMIEPRMYIKKCFADLVVKYGSIFGKDKTNDR